MVSPLAKNGIAGAVGLTVIILAATLGWILFPNIVNSVRYIQPLRALAIYLKEL